jgi:hypothetical protein
VTELLTVTGWVLAAIAWTVLGLLYFIWRRKLYDSGKVLDTILPDIEKPTAPARAGVEVPHPLYTKETLERGIQDLMGMGMDRETARIEALELLMGLKEG